MSKTENKHKPGEVQDFFHRFAVMTSQIVGSHWAFIVAVALIVVWVVTGPIFHFSDTWQLVINTATTIITFLMVFLIQHTQNRDAIAIHLKLDELLRGVKGARTGLVDLEDASEEELEDLKKDFERLRKIYDAKKQKVEQLEQKRTKAR